MIDNTAPIIKQLYFPSLNLNGPTTIEISADARDTNGAGILYARVYLNGFIQTSEGSKNVFDIGGGMSNSSKTFATSTDHLGYGEISILPTTASGEYSVGLVEVWDNAGGHGFYTAANLSAMGVKTTFTINNTSSSLTTTAGPTVTNPPTATHSNNELYKLGLSGAVPIFMSASGATGFTFTAHVSAGTSAAAPAYIRLFLDHPLITLHDGPVNYLDIKGVNKTVSTGGAPVTIQANNFQVSTPEVAEGGVVLDGRAKAGIYKVTEAWLVDSDGHKTVYSADQLNAMNSTSPYFIVAANPTPYQLPNYSAPVPMEMEAKSFDFKMIGSSASDTILYKTQHSNFQIKKTTAGFTVIDKAGDYGIGTLDAFEKVKFSDMTVDLTMGAKTQTISAASLKSLEGLYVAFFNRVPDADGLAYWISQVNSGQSLSAVANSFYSAATQYSSLTGYSSSMTDSDFVKVIYKNVLGRSGPTAPPDADVAYWSGELARGVTKGQMVATMLNSAHNFKGDATWGWVADLLDNKVAVADYFAIQAGITYASASESISKGMEIAAAVTSSDTTSAISLIGVAGLFALP